MRSKNDVARKNGHSIWTFAGSDRGADRAAVMLTLITTARLNEIDPKAWLADILARIADLPFARLHELPWEWKWLKADNPAINKLPDQSPLYPAH